MGKRYFAMQPDSWCPTAWRRVAINTQELHNCVQSRTAAIASHGTGLFRQVAAGTLAGSGDFAKIRPFYSGPRGSAKRNLRR